MARAGRFSFKRFLFHNKTVIFLVILFIVFVMLLPLQMEDSRSDRKKDHQKALHEHQSPYSQFELDDYYRLVFGIIPSNATKEVECENVWMFAVLPGFDIEDYVWEYLSLIAIDELYGEHEKRQVNSFLSKRSIEELESIFQRIHFTELGTVPDHCYKLDEAILVENGDNLNFNPNERVKSMYLLGPGERRYKEIAQIDGRKYRQYCRFNDVFKRVAHSDISSFKKYLEDLTGVKLKDNVPVVGMYIRTLELPSIYYERAMDFLRKIHYGSIFIVICPTHLLKDCQDRFSSDDTVVKIEQMLELELAILAMCNHTVVENEFGLLGALINENMGDVIVYDRMAGEIEWFAKNMTENFENWYSIA